MCEQNSFCPTKFVVRPRSSERTPHTKKDFYQQTLSTHMGNLAKPHEMKHDFEVNKRGNQGGGFGTSLRISFDVGQRQKKTFLRGSAYCTTT